MMEKQLNLFQVIDLEAANTTTIIISLTCVLVLASYGGYNIIQILLKKLKLEKAKKIKPDLNLAKIKQLTQLIEGSNLEERFFIIEMILGPCNILCDTSRGVITIKGCGLIPSQPDEPAPDYTG